MEYVTNGKDHITKGASSCGTQYTLRLRTRATIANTKKVVKGVRKLIKTKKAPRDAESNVHHGFGHALDLYMLSEAAQIAEEVWIQPSDEEWDKYASLSPLLPQDCGFRQLRTCDSVFGRCTDLSRSPCARASL